MYVELHARSAFSFLEATPLPEDLAAERFLKSGRAMEQLHADCPEAVANTGELALRLGFTLKSLGYQFPDYPLPPGQTPIGFLRALCERGARGRYGTGP